MPAMAAVTGFTAAMTALNTVTGGDKKEVAQKNQTEALKIELQEEPLTKLLLEI